MKRIVVTLIGIFLIILELSVFSKINFLGVKVNVLLIYSIIVATQVDAPTNYTTLIILGFIYDILISPFFGINMIWILLMSGLTRFVIDKLYEERLWSFLLIMTIISVLSNIYYFVVNQMLFIPQGINFLPEIFWRSVLINSIVGMVLCILFKPIFKHIMKNWW